MNLNILYEDEDLIVVNKPGGVLTIPDRFDPAIPALNKLVAAHLGQEVLIVHRLDRETSGAVCFAKNADTHKYLSKQFQEHQVEKLYAGIVAGTPNPAMGTIEASIKEHPGQPGKMMVAARGKPSKTDYRVVQSWPLYALIQFQIFTGRTHQIRVHMQAIAHPILCDPLYGDGKPFLLSSIKRKYKLSKEQEAERPLLDRLALHAYRLRLKGPGGKEVVAEAPLAKDIAACVQQLDKWAQPPVRR